MYRVNRPRYKEISAELSLAEQQVQQALSQGYPPETILAYMITLTNYTRSYIKELRKMEKQL